MRRACCRSTPSTRCTGRPPGACRIPVVFLHGGPGSGSTPKHGDSSRPTGSSSTTSAARGARPRSASSARTYAALVADLERLRESLGIERWLVFGGSWGSTLGLAYTGTIRPAAWVSCCAGSSCAARRDRLVPLWPARDLPRAVGRFAGFLPPRSGADLLGNYRRLIDPDPAVHMPAGVERVRRLVLDAAAVAGDGGLLAGDVVALGLARMGPSTSGTTSSCRRTRCSRTPAFRA